MTREESPNLYRYHGREIQTLEISDLVCHRLLPLRISGEKKINSFDRDKGNPSSETTCGEGLAH
jgi:hypothetical protein